MWTEPRYQDLDHYYQTQLKRLEAYEIGLAAGRYRPFIYPWDSLPALYLVLAILCLPRLPKRYAVALRWPVIVLILGHCIYVVRSCRTIGFAGGYGIGLSALWGCIMTFALLFFNDIRTSFARLEARELIGQRQENGNTNGAALSSCRDQAAQRKHSEGLKQRKPSNTERAVAWPTITNGTPYQLLWQTYPSNPKRCLDWTLDLLTCFRGVNWNFRDPTLTILEKPLNDKLKETRPGMRPLSTTSIDRIRTEALIAFIRLYLTLDLLKAVQAKDPYFFGSLSLDTECSSHIYCKTPFTLKAFRLTISVMSVYTALNFIFQLCPLFFTTIPLLIPYPFTIAITRTPLLNASMYEPYWGPVIPSVAAKGLAGFWGRFWHQLFRFGISQPSAYIIRRYNLEPRSGIARMIQVLTAFCLSGTIHAVASYTSMPPKPGTTHPVSGPWAFFMLQGVGILTQAYVTRLIKSRFFPLRLRQAGNILFVLLWGWFTGPLLADDFASCGVWLFEPLPVSFVKGISGEGWWRWGGRWVGWWSDPKGRWWKSGIAVY